MSKVDDTGAVVKTGGRKKGAINRRSKEVMEILDKLGCNPIEGMADIAKRALEDDDLALAGNMYKELAQYVAPKRKAIEHTGLDGGAIELDTVFTVNVIDA